MKGILYYIWSKGLLQKKTLQTTGKKTVRVLYTGKCDTENPHIFRDAKVEIDGTVWCGDVVLHENNSTRPHNTQDTENSGCTILHICLSGDCDTAIIKEKQTECLSLEIPKELACEFKTAEQRSRRFPCEATIAELPTIQLHSTLSRLLAERLEEKQKIIDRIFTQCDQRWDDTLLKVAIRSFGFGIQSDVFEEWGNLLNTQALGKHSNNLTQVEAILFGQAGLLDEESIPCYYRQYAIGNDYFNELKREYSFLRNKFGLASIDYRKWGAGNATPHLRIARIASLYYHKRLTISGITESYTLTELYRLLNTPLEGYWQNHTCFGGTETCGNGAMRQKQVDVIIINSVVPLLYIYGRHRREETLCSRAEELLHQIESEENSIIKRWRGQGVVVDCAADSQALLQLNRRYCRINNCTECHFGYHYIKERLDKHF